ncbi:MAG: hypothetical protein EBU85_01170, partial [Actinobacteria bacterium]|nr:hypothetical protein [Actinomycetota bacterium]
MTRVHVHVMLRRLWPVALSAAIIAGSQYVPTFELSRDSVLQRKGLEQSTVVCPTAPSTAGTTLLISSPEGAADVRSAPLPGRPSAVRARLAVQRITPNKSAALVTTGDKSVSRTDAVMLASGKATLVSGLIGQQCQAADSSWWFLGAASVYGRSDVIVLTNPTSTPTTVDIDALTSRGTLHSADSRGIAVPAHGRRVLAFASLFPGVSAAALHVTTTSGVIHAAVLVTAFVGTSGSGAEWLPATKPGLHIVPLSADVRAATLYVASTRAASIDVRAVGPAGGFTPTGTSGLSVAAGSVIAVKLPDIAPDAAALVITSSTPVTAAVVGRGPSSAGARSDLIATAGVATTAQRAQTFSSVPGSTARLVLISDAAQPTRIRLTTTTASGPWEHSISLAPGDARTVALPVNEKRLPVLVSAQRGAFAAV